MGDNSGININDTAPVFSLLDKDEKPINLADHRNKWVILYFYPKDDTPGCTIEAVDFTGQNTAFENLNTVIIGISPDSCQSHRKFSEKQKLKIILLSDPEHIALEKYEVWQLKKMYGKESYGVSRTTFIIDPHGKIVHKWEKVKAEGHVEEVLKKLKELQK